MDAENPKRHGQSPAPVDDADEVGVLNVVVRFGVAAIGVAHEHNPVNSGDPRAEIGAARGRFGDPGRERIDVTAIGADLGIGQIERGEREGGVGDIDVAVIGASELPQVGQMPRSCLHRPRALNSRRCP